MKRSGPEALSRSLPAEEQRRDKVARQLNGICCSIAIAAAQDQSLDEAARRAGGIIALAAGKKKKSHNEAARRGGCGQDNNSDTLEKAGRLSVLAARLIAGPSRDD